MRLNDLPFVLELVNVRERIGTLVFWQLIQYWESRQCSASTLWYQKWTLVWLFPKDDLNLFLSPNIFSCFFSVIEFSRPDKICVSASHVQHAICLFSWVVFILADNLFPRLPCWHPNFSLITAMPLWPRQCHRLYKLNYICSFSMLSEFTLTLLSIIINNFALPFSQLKCLILHWQNVFLTNFTSNKWYCEKWHKSTKKKI